MFINIGDELVLCREVNMKKNARFSFCDTMLFIWCWVSIQCLSTHVLVPVGYLLPDAWPVI